MPAEVGKALQRRGDVVANRIAIPARPSAELEIFANAQTTYQAAVLANVDEAPAYDTGRAQCVHAPSAERHSALRPNEPRNGQQRGRLAGPIGSDDGCNRAGKNAQ